MESYLFRQLLDSRFLKSTFGGTFFQPSAEILHRISLALMNMGGGNNVHKSGETWVIDFLCSTRFGNRKVTIFDCGANKGEYAFEVIKRLEDSCELYCFEPGQQAYFSLNERFASRDNVHIYNIGLGDREETLTLFSDGDEMSEIASLHQLRLDHRGIQISPKEQVSVSTIDLFCEGQKIDTIDLLKLDVEGSELMVLKGAQRLLGANRIGAIQFEFGSCNIASRTFFQDFFYLLNPRFQIYRILGNGLVPIENYQETYEVFITTNYLAISR